MLPGGRGTGSEDFFILDWTPVFPCFIFQSVSESLVVQGRPVGELELEMLRQWMGQNPGWSRWRLSQALATHWDWRNGAGQLKDMAARTLLLKLHQRGLIALPPRRQIPTNRMRCGAEAREIPEWDQHPIECGLAQLGVLTVEEVSGQAAERVWVKAALSQFHYLGFGGVVGENLQYVVRDGQGRLLACVVFGAAAWKCQDTFHTYIADPQYLSHGFPTSKEFQKLAWDYCNFYYNKCDLVTTPSGFTGEATDQARLHETHKRHLQRHRYLDVRQFQGGRFQDQAQSIRSGPALRRTHGQREEHRVSTECDAAGVEGPSRTRN